MSGTTPCDNITIRRSTADDVDSVNEFYSSNRHPEVARRTPELVNGAVRAGRALLVECNGQLVGCSLVYLWELNGDEYAEIGSTLITKAGAGIYGVLITKHIYDISCESFTRRIVMEVNNTNTQVLYLLGKLGCTEYLPDTVLVDHINADMCAEDIADVTWFTVSFPTAVKLSNETIRWIEKGLQKKGNNFTIYA